MSTYGVTTEFIVGATRSVGFLGGRHAFGDTDDTSGARGRDPVMLRGVDRMLSLAQPSRSGVRCGITEGRQVRCWGCGGEGALGGGGVPAPVCASSESSPGAFTVDLGEPIAQVALANASLSDTTAASVCALTETGRVRCWGANDRGQLGRGNTNPSSTLRAVDSTPIAGLVATEIAALDMAFCALHNGTDIVCWGERGSYGAASMMEPRSTLEVLARPSSSRLHMLRCVGGACCALERDTRELWCWGVQDEPNERVVPGLAGAAFGVGPTNIRPVGITLGTIEAIGVGDSICVLGRDSSMSVQVVCWGDNDGAESGRAAAPGTVGFGFVPVSGL